MSWKEVYLKDVVGFKYGKMPNKDDIVEDGFPIFSGYRIVGYHKEFLFEEPMVIIVARGVGGTGDVKMSPPFCYLTNLSIALITDDNTISKKFLKYRLSIANLRSLDSGAAQSQITIGSLEKFKTTIPILPTQKRIADILSAYDDLIDNNLRRIKLLEQAAQNIYKEWFVNLRFPGYENTHLNEETGLPVGWMEKTLGDFTEIKKGKNITKNTIKEGKVPVVAGGLSPAYYHDTSNTKNPVITVSASGANAGFTNIYLEDIWASDCSFIDKNISKFVYFIYATMLNRQEEISGLQRGAAQPHVYPKDLKRIEVLIPENNLISKYEKLVSPMFNMKRILLEQNQKLKVARDILLPRLMNRTIEV
ncbi:restriction endonuclease subunit S [Gaetbulibacter aquiaggeris]|uniref:Restriction endonuclease subunit S n=1 Tax=Gaetbulibacter aquiaggeris TaxID=1735373 RepID=A0ABW7MLA2_9FLAO